MLRVSAYGFSFPTTTWKSLLLGFWFLCLLPSFLPSYIDLYNSEGRSFNYDIFAGLIRQADNQQGLSDIWDKHSLSILNEKALLGFKR